MPTGRRVEWATVQQVPPAMTPEPSKPLLGRLLHPSCWPRARHRVGEQGSALAFGIRLLASVVLTCAVVGVAAYVLLERNQAQQQIHDYAAAQQADAKAFEAMGARAANPTEVIADIDAILDSVAKRPGTLEALLIDQRHVLRAAGNRL